MSRGGVELLVQDEARPARPGRPSSSPDSGRHAKARATASRRAAPEAALDGIEFFEKDASRRAPAAKREAQDAPPPAPAPATPAPAMPASEAAHDAPSDSAQDLDLEAARLADIALDDEEVAAARAASAAALGISLASLALTLGGGFLASRGQVAAGAVLYAAGVPTILVALSTLVCGARAAKSGVLFALASLSTLAAVTAATALVAVGG